ncbi:MAG: UDP-N-acetylmuramoyl-tripeptide-D-alanyl-D-alanine ligase [Parcubacteria group bacterium GW2011_GWB1_40_14]|nr:MAG: UDP-N-acetylmuramoyl-tripeptide-D-alanyl-D-alanine ligase [Parcubacteria group bacterium GW2011_GWB1_40_14]
MRNIIKVILYILSKAALIRYQPMVIGITGSVGKSSTKDAIFTILSAQYHKKVRKNQLNLNTEIGVPLTVLGISGGGRNLFKWFINFIKALLKILWDPFYPEILVLELGADKPGDIKYLANLIKPHIGVITAVGEIPVHVEFFAGPKNLAREKARLIEAIPPSGFSILNCDDDTVLDMRERSLAHVLTFGFGEGATVRATAVEMRYTADVNGKQVPDGINFKLEHTGKIVPVRLHNVFGKGAVYSALAAAACGIALKMNLVEIAEALGAFESPPGRLKLIEGEKNTFILDDTYNASPTATVMALETLDALSVSRRIAVLGDMLELGRYSEAAHRSIGEKAQHMADILITVGDRARFIANEALSRGMEENKIFSYSTTEEASAKLEEILKEGDLVLVKGSRAMQMEKIVKEIMAYPEKAERLLVH